MNTILNLPSPTQPSASSSGHRPRSKIARLPKSVRDRLNQMLEDGVPYKDIKLQLGDHGTSLTIDNISDWKTKGGYDTWVAEQFWREQMRARLETFDEPLTAPDADVAQLPIVALQISLTQLCEHLRDLGPGAGKDHHENKNNADHYLRMLNTVARLSKSLLALQQYRDATTKNAAAKLEKRDPHRDFSQEERQLWLDRADDLFNFKSAARLKRALEQAAQSEPSPFKFQISNPSNEPPAQPPPQSKIENQKSKIENSPELCYECRAPLPPLRPDGHRPAPACPLCGSRLYPAGTLFYHCQFCHTAHALQPNSELPSNCRRCGAPLPPPGQRFVTHCPACNVGLPSITNERAHPSPYCPECRATIPLLEPASPPSPNPWPSESSSPTAESVP
jgi:hypothetical protein